MKRTLNIVAIAIASTALSTSAFAGGDKHKDKAHMDNKASFTQLDADNSGTVTPSEINNVNDRVSDRLTQKWNELDTNQDGELDRTEFARFEPMTSPVTGEDKKAIDPDMNDY